MDLKLSQSQWYSAHQEGLQMHLNKGQQNGWVLQKFKKCLWMDEENNGEINECSKVMLVLYK